jgi:hypothetical protein
MEVANRLLGLSIKGIMLRAKYGAAQVKYRHHRHQKTYEWDWTNVNFNRIALVNLLIAKTGGMGSRYLEIGCAGNDLFDSVACGHKVGVDPVAGGTLRMTSDDFFRNNREIFDVIFVDGLHHYEQAKRDAANAVAVLDERGWVAFHDFLPRSWKEHHVPRLQNVWTGDCWKLALELASASGVEFKIIRIDHGVGVMRKVGDQVVIPDLSKELLRAEFDTFVARFEELPVVDWREGVDWIMGA